MLKKILFPLVNASEALSLILLYASSHGEVELDFVRHSFKKLYGKAIDNDVIRVTIDKFLCLLNLDVKEMVNAYEKVECLIKHKKQVNRIKNCVNCGQQTTQKKSKDIVTYTFDGPKLLTYYNAQCKICDINYDFEKYSCKNSVNFYHDDNYLMCSSQTCFEKRLLDLADEQIARNAITFEGFCDTYNNFFPCAQIRPLNRKRFSQAWFTYKIKQALPDCEYFKYDENESILEKYIDNLIDEFPFDWYKKHKSACSIENCQSISRIFEYLKS
jgi:transcription elongation factor Elf1